MQSVKYVLLVVLLIGLTAGCASKQEKRLLTGSQLVGAGYDVRYRAPVDGVVFYYDQKSKRILVTESLAKDEVFDTSADMYSEKLKMVLGNKVKKARLHLYFKPEIPRGRPMRTVYSQY